MFRHDIQHSGKYPSEPVLKAPTVKWKFQTRAEVNSSPALEGGSVFFGSGDSSLYCVDLNTGTLKWKHRTGGAVHSSPAIDRGLVFFGSYDGVFYALDAKTGKPRWTFKTDGEKLYSARGIHGQEPKEALYVDDWDFYLSSPAVADGMVYFGTGSGYFYALDEATGSLKWKFKTDGVIHSSPAVGHGNVYFGGWDTYMHALNAKTGAEVWRYKTGEDTAIYNQTGITSSPILDENTVYFGCRDSHVYALNAITGKEVWKKYNDRGWISVTPVIDGQKIVYASGSDKHFTILNKKTGEVVFQGSILGGVFSCPALAGHTVYYGDMSGILTAQSTETGSIIWKFKTDAAKADPYKILNPDGSMHVENFLAARKTLEGKKTTMQLRFSTGTILSSPILFNGRLYVGSADGAMYCLE